MNPAGVVPPLASRSVSYVKMWTFVYVFLSIMLLGVGQLWYWMLWPQTPLVLKTPIKVIEVDQFGANNTIVYEMTYCKGETYSLLDAEVHYTLLNHDAVIHEIAGMTVASIPYGCQTIKIALPIPLLKPGLYTLKMVRVYKVNPLKNVTVESTSPVFEIVASKEASAPAEKSLSGQPKPHSSPMPKARP